mgnify:CR=1 FL=1
MAVCPVSDMSSLVKGIAMSPAKSTISAHMPVRSLSVIALATEIALHTTPATADPSGQLVFLGWTADGQHSLCLSAVSPGPFEV